MAEERSLLRVVDELLWTLRRAGVAIATSQAIDAVRAIRAVGFDDARTLREALAIVLVTRAGDRARFDEAFDGFFGRTGVPRSLWERLEALGFSPEERATVRELLEAHAAASPGSSLSALVHGGVELDGLLRSSGVLRLLDGVQSPLQAGFFVHRLMRDVGATAAHDELALLGHALADALGQERGHAVVQALKRELVRASDDLRDVVNDTLRRREAGRAPAGSILDAPLVSLDEAQSREVRRAIRAFVQSLRGGEKVRRKRARRGRINPHRTLRLAMRTGGVPFALARRVRKRDRPRLFILCDVSDSVRSVSRFTLEMTIAAQELFRGTRSFVFVSELGETTELFANTPVETALGLAYQGAVVPVTHNSNYGRVLRAFEGRALHDLDRRTTVVIVGDGRTNYQPPAADVLDSIRARARALLWLCPEPKATWSTGDSAMSRYAPKCTKALEVRTARDLEDAARLVLSLR